MGSTATRFLSAAGSLVLAVAVLLPGAQPVAAQSAEFCRAGQQPEFVFGFATLRSALGARMGEPTECEHANADNGDTLQRTSTGLAFYRKSTNTPTFTDGWTHWASTPVGMVTWQGTAIDPPPAVLSQATAGGVICQEIGDGLCVRVEAGLADTITLLAGTSAAAPLIRTAARSRVLVRYGQTPPSALGSYGPGRDVVVNRMLQTLPTISRAPIVAHELQHVADWLSEGRALATTSGCLATEANAFAIQSQAWTELNGGQLPRAANRVDTELNRIAEFIKASPTQFLEQLRRAYDDECS